MTGYWDIHNHILPGVDDGSGCMRETMEMLEEEYRQGVRHIVFTPHYRRGFFDDMHGMSFEKLEKKYAETIKVPFKNRVKRKVKNMIKVTLRKLGGGRVHKCNE